MSLKDRVKFTVAGSHPLLYLLRDRLIHQGLALVTMAGEELPDFVLYGADIGKHKGADTAIQSLHLWAPVITAHQIPVFLLSSSELYSDRTRETAVADKLPSAEHHACVVPSPLEPAAGKALFAMLAEWTFSRQVRTLVLRPFNLYGPDITWGVIHEWLSAARRNEALSIHGNGYQTRTYLYQDDFYECFDKLLRRFCSGAKGIYNVGHDQEISLKRLADSIWQLTHGVDVPIVTTAVKAPCYHVQWKLPDLTRVKAFAGWKPKTSLRGGLFLMTESSRR